MTNDGEPLSTRLNNYRVRLPIPDHVIDAIEKGREKGIAALFQEIADMVENFQTHRLRTALYERCSLNHCMEDEDEVTAVSREGRDAMVRDSLIRGLSAVGLYPCALPPFHGFSLEIEYLSAKLQQIELLSPCQWTPQPNGNGHALVKGGCHSTEKGNPLAKLFDEINNEVERSCPEITLEYFERH
ncbi:hypothetical protein DSL72_005194 [Monilinia vaccinii-corymbosi]|uniref:Uncharacterized protein n=1 Tax=Monilinia vaccinii-corymbosi TaxID=61207 RepID=A0A8A3PF12_9HELO|nr:hypothetical protein DSL72_005194 [Monilinia vaccinii-corymbosi]